MLRNSFIILLMTFVLFSCKKDKEQQETKESYFKGELTILTDDAYKSVAEALAEAYTIQYPEAKITTQTEKEDFALLALLQKKTKIAILSRELTKQERELYKQQTDLDYQPVYFAADAVVFVTAKENPLQYITIQDIQNRLLDNQKTIVFDGANAANLNFIAQYFQKRPKDLQYSILNGNKTVLKEIPKHIDKIGVISLNSFSRIHNPETKLLKENIKVLPIKVNSKYLTPNLSNLKDFSYPFTRKIYFLSSENTFQIANGFMHFACSQIGQLVIDKEGLQPYYLFNRQVQMK